MNDLDVSARSSSDSRRPLSLGWLLICTALVVASGLLRLVVYPGRVVPLTDALPLLVCLLHRDVRLLWGMAIACCGFVVFKLIALLPPSEAPHEPALFGVMLLANILLPATVLHIVLRLGRRLENAVADLGRSNADLLLRNEEIVAREEEIAQQNEELVSQTEELEHQAEELNIQTEELQSVNELLAVRERTLTDLLETASSNESEAETLKMLGASVDRLLGPRAAGAAVLELRGGQFDVLPLSGLHASPSPLPRERTLAELCLSRNRPAFVADLALRTDLVAPRLASGARPQSSVCAPLRVGGAVRGVLEVYSARAGDWTEQELLVVQWLAEQCGRLWTTSRLREELERRRELLRTVTDTSTVALFLTDDEGRCTYLNPAARRLTGLDVEELGHHLLHEALGRPEPFVSTSTPDGTLPTVEIRGRGGVRIPVMVTVSPVLVGGHSIATVVEVRDATELRRHESEREQLLASERAARTEAERASRAKDEFVATLSHELRTPLNAVLGWAVLLRNKNCTDPAEVARGVEVIERNARHQAQLISDLLDISRIVSGKVLLDVQSVDLRHVVGTALESVRLAADAKGITLERQTAAVDCTVTGDTNRLQQVVWNLLTNAVKFTPRDGTVQVTVDRAGSCARIVVRDSGEGIELESLPLLFERYRQADTSSTRRHGGLGLGLAIAKSFVEMHGGTIHAESLGKGHGATFTVLLPLRAVTKQGGAARNDEPGERGWDAPPSRALAGSTAALNGLAILVVDDEPDARELIRQVLTERGARVLTADSGEAALVRLSQDEPDLLISDIGMPGMDGYALIRKVRERPSGAHDRIPAIALTALARSEDRTRALLAGFHAHISKPVEPAELIATVTSLRSLIGMPQRRQDRHDDAASESV